VVAVTVIATALAVAVGRGWGSVWVALAVLTGQLSVGWSNDTYAPEPGAFDLVLVAYLQTPAADRAAWLGHATDALAPGGTLLIVGHDRTNLEHGYGGPQDAAVLTTPQEVAAALDGLRIEKAERVERTVETPDGERVAIDHLVRARRP